MKPADFRRLAAAGALLLFLIFGVWQLTPPSSYSIVRPPAAKVEPPRPDPESKSTVVASPASPTLARASTAPAASSVCYVTPAAHWSNQGRDTLAHAVESGFWAGAAGDIPTLAATLVIGGRNRVLMKELTDRLSSNLVESYPSAEELAALMVASETNVRGFLLREERLIGDGVTAAVLFIPGANGKYETEEQYFRREPDGQWKRVVFAREIMRWIEIARRDNMAAAGRKK